MVTGESTRSQTMTYRSNDRATSFRGSESQSNPFISLATAAAAVCRVSLQTAGAAVRVRHLLSSQLAWGSATAAEQPQCLGLVISPNDKVRISLWTAFSLLTKWKCQKSNNTQQSKIRDYFSCNAFYCLEFWGPTCVSVITERAL